MFREHGLTLFFLYSFHACLHLLFWPRFDVVDIDVIYSLSVKLFININCVYVLYILFFSNSNLTFMLFYMTFSHSIFYFMSRNFCDILRVNLFSMTMLVLTMMLSLFEGDTYSLVFSLTLNS